MKKLSLIAACAMSVTAFAGMEKTILCSSTGPDRYADGTEVQVGEIYALVWTANGEFSMDATGKPDTSKCEILGMVSTSKPGRCSPIIFVLNRESDDRVLTSGSISLYLFDTRVKNDGEEKPVVTFPKTGSVIAYNAYEKVAASVTINNGSICANTGVTIDKDSVTADPVVVTPATISGITVKDGKVYVDVENTIPAVRYAISAGKTPAANDKVLANGVNGIADGKITLVVDDPDKYRFFKVVRSN